MRLAEGKVGEVQAFRLKMPLQAPYLLSLGEINHFDMFLVRVQVEGEEGIGETVPLPGYSGETAEVIWGMLQEWTGCLPGMEAGEALELLKPLRRNHPFAATAMVTAVETALQPLEVPSEIEIPLLGTVMTHCEEELEGEIESLLHQGYTTLKVKVGWDEREDAAHVRRVQEMIGDRAMIRLDANQAYSLEQATFLVRHVDPANIELFEQPFNVGEWEDMLRLSDGSPLPLMLDESITSEAALEKMIRLRCAQVVKFKLMKAGGLAELEQLILRAGDAGLKVVLGNGVAGDIGNFHEMTVAANHVETAGEMNGFLKQKERLLLNPYVASRGRAMLPRNYTPEVDWEKVERYSVATLHMIR